MKALIYHEFGEVGVLKYEDTPVPEINDDEVLIKVRASSINSLDNRLRSGKSPRPVDLPHIGGIDISGDVDEIGKDVSGFSKGDRVVIDPTVRLDKGFEVIGVNRHGGFAEYAKVPGINVVKIPDNLEYDDASTLPICFATAWYGLYDRGGIQDGERVLVHAAGSGTGSAAIQVAKNAGAFVIATAGSDEKLENAKKLGADETINYNNSDFAEEVKRITENKGVNIIFDQIGASVWEKNIQSLSGKGRLLLVGVVGGGAVNAMIGPIIMRDLSVLGVTVFNSPRKNLESVVRLASEGTFKSIVYKKFPLEHGSDAQKILEDRNQFGKVVLNP